MAKINFDQLRTYATEALMTLEQSVSDSIRRESDARRQAIEEKKIRKLRRRKKKLRQAQANRD